MALFSCQRNFNIKYSRAIQIGTFVYLFYLLIIHLLYLTTHSIHNLKKKKKKNGGGSLTGIDLGSYRSPGGQLHTV